VPQELAGATVPSRAARPEPAAEPPVSAAAIRAAAEDEGLVLSDGVYAAVAAALAGGHVVLVGPAGSGKTTLALAIAKAAAQSGRSSGATLATAAHRWGGRDTVGRPGDEEWERGVVVDAAVRGRWLVLDELDRARLDRALGELSSYLGGAPVALPDGEATAPDGWRIVATAGPGGLRGSPALVRRFAHVELTAPAEPELLAAIEAAAAGDAVAAAAVGRLVGARDLGPVGTGAFLAAARFAAARNAIAPAPTAALAREALAAHIAPLLGELDADGRARLTALAGT
jgi:MoxR-like ATPase